MVRPVRVLFFATARAAVGSAQLDRSVPPSGTTVRALVDELVGEYPQLERVVRVSRLVRNGRYVRRSSERVRPGDELAVHPPYSGG
jgi:molybdopterin converting factor small subunit